MTIRDSAPALERFKDPAALLSHLHAARGTDDERNAILAALVTAAQREAQAAESAAVLLQLALWPGLDALHGRLLRHFRHQPEDLATEIASRVAIGIRRLDLRRVSRIAATLILNTKRDILRMLRAGWSDAPAETELDVRQIYWREHPASPLGLPDEVATPTATSILRDRMEPIIGPDTDLVLAIAVCGDDQRSATAALGLDYETGRKRYLRAIARLRKALAE